MKNPFQRDSFPIPLLSYLTIPLLLLLILSSCNTTGSDDHDHDHDDIPNIWGLELMDSEENLVARQFGDEVTYTEGESLTLPEGEQSSRITVRFLDEHEDIYLPEEEDLFLEWLSETPEHVEILPDDADRWSFRLSGLTPGTSRVRFSLMHGHDAESAHSDFVSRWFVVQVLAEEESSDL